jgi:hypothetical protein
MVTTGKYQLRAQPPFEVYGYSRVKQEICIHFTDIYLPVEPVDKKKMVPSPLTG